MISAQIFSLLKHYFDKFHGLVVFWPWTLLFSPRSPHFSNTLAPFWPFSGIRCMIFCMKISSWCSMASHWAYSQWFGEQPLVLSPVYWPILQISFYLFCWPIKTQTTSTQGMKMKLGSNGQGMVSCFFAVGMGMHFFKRVTVEFGSLSQLYNISNVSICILYAILYVFAYQHLSQTVA